MSTIIIRRNEVLCDSLQIKTVCDEVLVNTLLDVDVISLRDSITLTTECRPTGRLALRISGIGTSETYSSLRELLLRLMLKSGTTFYIMSCTTFKSGRLLPCLLNRFRRLRMNLDHTTIPVNISLSVTVLPPPPKQHDQLFQIYR